MAIMISNIALSPQHDIAAGYNGRGGNGEQTVVLWGLGYLLKTHASARYIYSIIQAKLLSYLPQRKQSANIIWAGGT